MQMAAVYARSPTTACTSNRTWSVDDRAGRQRTPAAAPETRQVLGPQIAAQLRTMLEAVVTVKGATGTQAAVDGYRVAGKTGTGKLLIDGRYPGRRRPRSSAWRRRTTRGTSSRVFAHMPGGTGGAVAGAGVHAR